MHRLCPSQNRFCGLPLIFQIEISEIAIALLQYAKSDRSQIMISLLHDRIDLLSLLGPQPDRLLHLRGTQQEISTPPARWEDHRHGPRLGPRDAFEQFQIEWLTENLIKLLTLHFREHIELSAEAPLLRLL